ncbi:hypothetical protein EAG08_07180 [Chryseobacterium sp. 3008163]|nr:hypothetical protein EAG08_07180 [Chryseobacterium sp. 3008163]
MNDIFRGWIIIIIINTNTIHCNTKSKTCFSCNTRPSSNIRNRYCSTSHRCSSKLAKVSTC